MKRLLPLTAAVLSSFAAMSADIAWTIGANTVNDTDVRTDGKLVYAYAVDDCTVNGVAFMGTPGGTNWLQDVTFSTTYGKATSAYWYDPNNEWTAVSAGYKTILKGGSYTAPNVKNDTYTLRHLVPGRRYLVQWWFNDMRAERTASSADIGGSSALRLTMSGHPLGAHAVGLFTADAETQAFSVVYGIEGQINALQLRCLDPDADIAWEAHVTAGIADVVTEGVRQYAYVPAGSGMCVKGESFVSVAGGVSAFGDDIAVSPSVGSRYTGFFNNDATGYAAEYAGLIACGFYRDNPSPEGMVKRYVTLKNLTPGATYVVQLWTADNRSGTYGNRWMTLDGQVTLRHCATSTTGGPGMYAIGRFTAVGSEQVFVAVHSTSGSKTNSGQELFGPIQVRCVSPAPGMIAWTKGDTAADGSVDARGNCLYAYSANAVTVNGTPFTAAAGGSTMGDDVTLSSSFTLNKSAFVSHTENFDADALQMLRGAYYYLRSGFADVTFTLRHLVAGRRYLVQLWSCDDRDGRGGSGYNVGDVRLEYNNLNGGSALRGQCLKGVFTATDDTQSFTADTPTGYEWTFNALQVRELDAAWTPLPLAWTARDLTTAETASVETQGSLLYAFGMATSAFTANGVTFKTVDTTKTVWGDGAVTIDGTMSRHTAFYTGTDVTGGYRNILACGLYNAESGAKTKTFTLGKLSAGHRYLVQYFVSDTRNTSVAARTATFSDGTQLRFGDNGDGQHALGMTAVGTFVADGATKAFTVDFWTSGVQINGLQVRDLGFDGIVWAGGASGSWLQDGAGWTRGGASCEGTVLWDAATGPTTCAEIPGGTALSLAEDVWAGSLFSSGEIVLGESGTARTLTLVGEIQAPLATVNAVWGGYAIRKSVPGETVFAGAIDNVRYVTVGDGVCTLATPSRNALVVRVAAPGTLKAASGQTVPVESLSGDGTVGGEGRFDLSAGGEVDVSAFTCTGANWGLFNGTTLKFAGGTDFAGASVYVENPVALAEAGTVLVAVDGKAVHRPALVYPGSDTDRQWRLDWSAEKGGFVVARRPGCVLIYR